MNTISSAGKVMQDREGLACAGCSATTIVNVQSSASVRAGTRRLPKTNVEGCVGFLMMVSFTEGVR